MRQLHLVRQIDVFDGKYRFLSNFYPCKIIFDGLVFPSTENAFQAAKTLDPKLRKRFVGIASGNAKKIGRQIVLRSDWEQIKLSVMENLLRQKFNQPEFRELLQATGHVELIEGNWWGDRFWGVCKGVGENHLGKLLMKIRSELVGS